MAIRTLFSTAQSRLNQVKALGGYNKFLEKLDKIWGQIRQGHLIRWWDKLKEE
ncbi:hypothetical protein [Amphibacillus sediminis]|uniref:hypothetical protein n=1 Tax=Amphibacillus sediminis TaxID=360185 RepID=UPI0012ED2C5C|nr:hypothetical protein [Amphibacillus sediminis]